VITPEYHRDDFLLERPELSPTKAVDDVVLQAGMEEIERIHKKTLTSV
jgi:hypothetical protein